ncbi:anti-sigma factor domain-containing protein [Planctomonas deserti]|uniref:anti-sigma factor domain-containing protein n=1 Tax=Planctomonas deserti TaxID=2144185 RepID=UPI000D3C9B7C|nr:anti-sigma factor [Planctomonas deserti]
MTHTDPDVLALLALGESAGTAEDVDHVARCGECAGRLDEFALVVTAGRATDASARLEQPSDRVWAGISSSLGLSPGLVPDVVAGRSVGTAASSDPASADPSGVRPAPAPPGTVDASPAPASAPVTPLRPRRADRGRRTAWLAVAAGILVVAGVGTTLVVGSLTAGEGDVVAEATLDALPAWPDARGSAEVREVDGERVLSVNVSRDTRPDTVREVWLISSDLTKLVSVGLLATDEGTFPLPADIDLAEYSVVDVSAEPLDGDPGHSSDSIVRGGLSSRPA